MLGPAQQKLLSIASPAIVDAPPVLGQKLTKLLGQRHDELLALLRERNGFYAFESALHVFPATTKTGVMDLEQWNSDELWRNKYDKAMVARCVFFAEDVFGCPFVIRDDKIFSMDPENGELEAFADDLEGWAAAILGDFEFATGQPLAHSWQEMRGPLAPGRRLFPGVPFVLDGAYEVENLRDVDAAQAMRFRGQLASQLKNVPPGAKVQFKFK
jgi:hypothetical protein